MRGSASTLRAMAGLSPAGLRLPPVALGGFGLLALGLAALLHLLQGQHGIDAATVANALLSPADTLEHHLIRHIRLPRVAAAILAGAALGASGALFQAATRNPLTSPGILGVSSGAYLALALGAALLPAGLLPPIALAFLGGCAAAGLVFAIAGGSAAPPLRLTLAGAAATLALGAFTWMVALFHEEQTASVFLWGAGSLAQSGWDGTRYAAPYAALGLGAALLLGRALDILALGEDSARALGQRVGLVRTGAMGAGTLLAAAAICVAGPINFVGLIAPNLLRMLGVGSLHALVPLSAIWGAVLLVAGDTVAQAASDGTYVLPAGVVTALVGAPIFILLIYRTGRQERPAPRPALVGARATARLPLPVLVALLCLLVLAVLFAGVGLGQLAFTPSQILGAVFGTGERMAEQFVVGLRLPRVLVALVAGAMLAASGVLLQGVIRNPLAGPELIGVSQGAALAALGLLMLWPGAPLAAVQLAAFAGGFGVLALVLAVARRIGLTPSRLALVGLAVTAFCGAGTNWLIVEAKLQGAFALVWLAGTTYARGWPEVLALLPWALALLPLAWALARWLDLLALGEDLPRAVGVPVPRARAIALVAAATLAAAAVAAVGAVAFVGLLAPHAARLLLPAGHRRLMPVAMLLGALLLGAADVIGRNVLAPKEIPAGMVTALIGTPYFLFLLWRGRARA